MASFFPSVVRGAAREFFAAFFAQVPGARLSAQTLKLFKSHAYFYAL
jgi:hypothetical protein